MMESDREQGCLARSPAWTHTAVPCPAPPTAFIHPMARGHTGWWERTGDPPGKPVHAKNSRTPCLNPKTDSVLRQGLKDTTIWRAPVQLVPHQEPTAAFTQLTATLSEGTTWFRKETGLQHRGLC